MWKDDDRQMERTGRLASRDTLSSQKLAGSYLISGEASSTAGPQRPVGSGRARQRGSMSKSKSESERGLTSEVVRGGLLCSCSHPQLK